MNFLLPPLTVHIRYVADEIPQFTNKAGFLKDFSQGAFLEGLSSVQFAFREGPVVVPWPMHQ